MSARTTMARSSTRPAARRTMLAGLLATATVALTGALGAGEAHAVPPLKEYPATANLDGRREPKFGGEVIVDFVHAGQTVTLLCQQVGEEAYGSRLWDLVDVKGDGSADIRYVPDRFIKTGTDGRVPGVEDCPGRG